MSFHRGPAGEPGRGLIYRGLWEMVEGALEMERFSLKGVSSEGFWGGLFTRDPGRYVKKGSGYGHLSP